MRINYICLKGFKRFRLANIQHFEAEFPEAITVIIAESGKGKSSLLAQLNPLPAVRTDFEKDGYKEIRITHENHEYKLISDFSNKTAPHSFICDEIELNQGHTTDVQMELVTKHFGLTNFIYDLIYSRIKLTNTTKSERKNLFLKINPMDLGLILEAHKRALSKLKDCKANIQMLQSRKTELENSMLDAKVLEQHITTRDNLQKRKQAVDQIIYTLRQHIQTILNTFSEDVDYYRQHSTSVVPVDDILQNCKVIRNQLLKFSSVERGDAYDIAKQKIVNGIETTKQEQTTIRSYIEKLSKEINEYQKHLDETKDNPVSKLEAELTEINAAIAKYPEKIDKYLSINQLGNYRHLHDKLTEELLASIDAESKYVTPTEYQTKLDRGRSLYESIQYYNREIASLQEREQELSKQIEQDSKVASIPSGCVLTGCGLRNIFTQRSQAKQNKVKELKTTIDKYTTEKTKLVPEYTEICKLLEPYKKYNLANKFNTIKSYLSYFNMTFDDSELVRLLNTSPMKLARDAQELIDNTIAHDELTKLQVRKEKLETELMTVVKSTGVSVDFLTKELASKEAEVKANLSKLNKCDTKLQSLQNKYNLYLEYSVALAKGQELQDKFTRGERALLVKSAYDYWNELKSILEKYATELDSQLRELESLVREQEVQRKIYDTEIVANLNKLLDEKTVYEKIETALSPNTGLAYKSMLKYMNVLINNVNHFLAQVWSYPLKIDNYAEGDTLDYGLPLKVGTIESKDISLLSDGQKEIMDLSWTIAILLQMKLLNKVPFYADEITRCMDGYHRGKTIEFLNALMDNKLIEQCFIINHFVSVSEGFKTCNVVCLSTENLSDIPENANAHVTIC